eukprot:372043_1
MSDHELQPAVDSLAEFLISKNVPGDIARQVWQSVLAELGQNGPQKGPGVFPDAYYHHEAPGGHHDIAAARQQGQPYTVVFIGTNGVGKSTSLAKVGSYLT